jgi:hypothetical protein
MKVSDRMRHIPRQYRHQPLMRPIRGGMIWHAQSIYDSVAVRRVMRSGQSKRRFIDKIVLCTDNTTKVGSCETMAVMRSELRDLGDKFEMLRYMDRRCKQKSCQRVPIEKTKTNPEAPLNGAERAKIFNDRRVAKRESACQRSTSNAASAIDLFMELHAEMLSADTDVDVNEAAYPVRFPLRAPKIQLRTCEP